MSIVEDHNQAVAVAIGGSMAELKALREEGRRRRHAERKQKKPHYADKIGVVSGKRDIGGRDNMGHMKGRKVWDPLLKSLEQKKDRNWAEMPHGTGVSAGYRAAHSEWERSRNPDKRTPYPATPSKCRDVKGAIRANERVNGVWLGPK